MGRKLDCVVPEIELEWRKVRMRFFLGRPENFVTRGFIVTNSSKVFRTPSPVWVQVKLVLETSLWVRSRQKIWSGLLKSYIP